MANGDQNVPEMHVQDVEEHEQDSLVQKVKMALIGVIAIGAVAVVFTVITGSADAENQEASFKLGRAANAFVQGDYQTAISGNPTVTTHFDGKELSQPGLEDIANQYSGTEPGAVAAMMAGRVYLMGGDIANAQTMFQKASSSTSRILKSGGNAGIGACESANGNHAAAAASYVLAADNAISDYNAAMYRMMAADLFAKAGDQGKADEQTKIVAAMSGNNQYIAEARELAK